MDYWKRLKTSADRNRRMVNLRSKGWTYDRLAKEFGITRARVHQIVQRAERTTQ